MAKMSQAERDFYIQKPRMIIRIVMALSQMKPKIKNEKFQFKKLKKRLLNLDHLIIPKFKFVITSLKRRSGKS